MRIAIDCGHGSNTAGKRTPPMPKAIDIDGDGKVEIKKGEQYREHYANVGVGKLLVTELERCGFEVFKSAFGDDDIPLTDRQKAITKAKCDYSISIHFNAYGDGTSFNTAEGVAICIHDKYAGKSKKLAETVLKYLMGGTKQKNRGVSPRALAMCNCNSLGTKAAILCELAFMTNEREAVELMAASRFWKESAIEIAKGLCEYTGVKYVPEIIDTNPTKTITSLSPKEDIKWLQINLNQCLGKAESFIPLLVDGSYGSKTRIAILIYWERLGWNKKMEDDGTKAGKETMQALLAGRKE